MFKVTRSYQEDLLKGLQDPNEAVEYLNAALIDGSQENFLMALRDVAESRGIIRLSQQTKENSENIYCMLSGEGNPKLSSLNSILDNLGLKLAIEAKESFTA